MASVWRTRDRNGRFHERWHFRFINWQGKRQNGTGTASRSETLRMAQRLEDEHRQIRLGYRPPPRRSDRKHRFDEIAQEYLAWGRSQGGRGGRPWGKTHSRMRAKFIKWWKERLGLELLSDLEGSLPRVEKALRELQDMGRAGKTLQSYSDGIVSFCNWCESRGYLAGNPLKGLAQFDTTPKTKRRAATLDEIRSLLTNCPPRRRNTYEVALASGLRAGELRALQARHLSVERCGLYLEADWTKNRKPGFQPLSAALVARLAESVNGGVADAPLLRVTSHPARELEKDLKAAGIPKWTPEGKIDFHALRVAYTTLVIEAGANLKEAQSLARHATPELTANIYARTRLNRLQGLAEAVGAAVEVPPESQTSIKRAAAGAEGVDVTPFDGRDLGRAARADARGFDSRRPRRPDRSEIGQLTTPVRTEAVRRAA